MFGLPDRGVAGGEDGLHCTCGYGVVLGMINLESENSIWLGCLGCLDRLGLGFSLREDLQCR